MNTVVYYPHIYPTIEWLKVAALCWDKVYSLSAEGVQTKDDHQPYDEFLWAMRDEGDEFLDFIGAGLIGSSSEVQEEFKGWVKGREDTLKNSGLSESDEHFWDNFIVRGKFPSENSLLDFLRERGLAREETRSYDEKIPRWELEAEKLSSRLWGFEAPLPPPPPPKPGSDHEKYEKLMGKALEQRLNHNDDKSADALQDEAERIRHRNLVKVKRHTHVVYLPKDIALHYLSLCAAKAAAEQKSDLIAFGEEYTDVVFHSLRSLRGEVATAILEAYLPADLANLTPEQIAEFRFEFAAERLKYQKAIQSIVNEYADVASEGQLGKLRERIVDLAKERVEKTKVTYRHAKLDMIVKTFGITLAPPALATSIASALGIGLFVPAGIAAALSLFTVSRLLEWDKARWERSESPWSYVIDAAKL